MQSSMYGTMESTSQNQFEGVTVSMGFIWSMQDMVLRLERNQQDLIRQLDHAKKLANEYHETAVMYHGKYDKVLYEINELKLKHEHEIAVLFEKINRAEEEKRQESAIKELYAHEIELLERQFANCVNKKNDRKDCEPEQYIEAYKSGFKDCEKCSNGEMFANAHHHHDDESEEEEPSEYEEMSPVSVASPSPRQQQRPIQSFNRCYSESEESKDEDEDEDTKNTWGCHYSQSFDIEDCNKQADNNPCDECCSSQSSCTYNYNYNYKYNASENQEYYQSDDDSDDYDYDYE